MPNGYSLRYIDYTEKFLSAMKNWEIEDNFKAEREKAEKEIEQKLKTWKKITALYISKDDTYGNGKDFSYILHLKAGKWNVYDTHALDSEVIHIYESKITASGETSIYYIDRFNKLISVRTIQKNPFKLEELYDKYDKKSFW